MPDFKSNFWDERYSSEEYVYGTEPNQFFKEQIDKSSPGKLLLPGEGEGRNAVYAAKIGWQVDAFDQSRVAKEKALKLADKFGVSINYSVIDLYDLSPYKNFYDAAAIIFVHLAPIERQELHRMLISSLSKGGVLILELFSKNQLGKASGGPQDLSMLSSTEEILNDFKDLKMILIEERNLFLNEGDKHSGEASVVRFVGEKVD